MQAHTLFTLGSAVFAALAAGAWLRAAWGVPPHKELSDATSYMTFNTAADLEKIRLQAVWNRNAALLASVAAAMQATASVLGIS